MKCLICNKGNLVCNKKKYHYLESGLDNVYLEGIEICFCPLCGEEIVNIPSVTALHNLIGKILVRKKSLLNGKEIRFLRKNMGYSAKKFSSIIGVDNTTFSKWENANQGRSNSNDRFIRLIYSEIKNLPRKEIKPLVENDFEVIKSIQEMIPFNICLQDGTFHLREEQDSF